VDEAIQFVKLLSLIFPQDNRRIKPQAIALSVGSDLHLTCVTKSIPVWYFHWTVFKHDDEESSNILFPSYNEFWLRNFSRGNTGVYRCTGTTEEDLDFMASMIVLIKGELSSGIELKLKSE